MSGFPSMTITKPPMLCKHKYAHPADKPIKQWITSSPVNTMTASRWKNLHEKLYKHQIKNSVSNIFHNLLVAGLYHSRGEPTDIDFHHAPHKILQLYQQQEQLGW